VLVVGLPFPNARSPELAERMKYVHRVARRAPGARDPAAELYENMAMNAVNQSIGEPRVQPGHSVLMTDQDAPFGMVATGVCYRPHSYPPLLTVCPAGLILVDARYAGPRIRNKLPKWIGESVCVPDTFGGAMKTLGAFYRGRREVAS
jgi:chromosome transmission fidelity protein 1